MQTRATRKYNIREDKGMAMGIRRDLVERGMGIETKGEGILTGTVRMGKKR